jgi:hypothetical protein
MKGFILELAPAGKRVDDDELKGYILNGLDGDYNPLVASIKVVPSTTLNDMCAQLQAYESHQSMLSKTGQNSGVFQSSTNAASRCPYYPNRPPSPPHGGNTRQGGGWERRDGGYERPDGRN